MIIIIVIMFTVMIMIMITIVITVTTNTIIHELLIVREATKGTDETLRASTLVYSRCGARQSLNA